jgi:hypothetical protein
MATRKKAAKRGRRKTAKPESVTVSIDLTALDKLYRNRYEVSLDGGDTKGGTVVVTDGDTKKGVRIRDGDTKGAPVRRQKSSKTPRKPSGRRR